MASPSAKILPHWRLGDILFATDKKSIVSRNTVSSKKITKIALAFACGGILAALPQSSSAKPEANKPEKIKASICIDAPREVVWQAVHDERKHDPDLAYSKIIVPGEHEYVLEQKMVLIPVFGSAVCEMQNKEVPLERIDYKLIKSDRFKHMEGSWVLTPTSDGKTTLELSTSLDLGMPVPKSVINSLTAKKLQRRLQHVKESAETLNIKLAQSKKAASH
jgi:ribosome-associated toxin RatA of RatAB toxin-antitoxin module